MHWTQRQPFATQRRVTGSLEYWMHLVACYVVNCTEQMAQDIAHIAMREQCGVWHAAWLYRGSQPSQCGCVKCRPNLTKAIYDVAPSA